MADIHTHHDVASLERACRDADTADLVGSWLMTHANLAILCELARRGITEHNVRQLAAELNIGIGTMMVEFRRRELVPPEVAVRSSGVPHGEVH